MSRILTITALTIFGLTIFLSSCGEEYEDMTSTSIYIPISFAPSSTAPTAQAQGGYSAKITITGPDMDSITHNQNLTIKPWVNSTHDDIITIDDIPVGDNRIVKVEILLDGEVLFDGSDTVNLSGNDGNYVSITLDSVLLRKIVGLWLLTDGSLLIAFNADGTAIFTTAQGSLPGTYAIWGNGIAMTIADEATFSGNVSISGNTMTITYTSDNVEIYERQ